MSTGAGQNDPSFGAQGLNEMESILTGNKVRKKPSGVRSSLVMFHQAIGNRGAVAVRRISQVSPACCVPQRVFITALRFSKDETRFCRSGKQAIEECWRCCVPQKLQTSYLLCLGSPRTADQRQARDVKATSSFRSASPSPFVSTLSVSPYQLQPFLLLQFPLICSPVLWHSLHLSHPRL